MKKVVVTGSFDDLRSKHIRFLEEASKLGSIHLLLWSDETTFALCGKKTKFPQEERLYFLESIRYLDQVTLATGSQDIPNVDEVKPDIWVVNKAGDDAQKQRFCESNGIEYIVLEEERSSGFSKTLYAANNKPPSPKKKVVVTGCYDWLHSGHVRFFEETSELGDLYVIVGHDKNVRLLKGDGHPLFSQEERRYMVQAVRYVKQALITSGHGWMDAEPEITQIKPDIYVVNEEGDKPEKREFCARHGLEYIVLKRVPKEGLTRRQSTQLRGY